MFMTHMYKKIIDNFDNYRVWNQAIEGVDCGQEASDWFSKYLNKPGVRLIQHMPNLPMRGSSVAVNKKLELLKKYPVSEKLKHIFMD